MRKARYGWDTVYVFISSTFLDFQAERDYLLKYVFPSLREWCVKWKLHLVDVDLRWGVTKEEAESGKAIDICLGNVDKCRPFFISLLGSRYGWVPQKEEIPAGTFRRYERLKEYADISITHLEILHAVLAPLHPNVHAAQHAFFYFRNPSSLPSPESLSGLDEKWKQKYASIFLDSKENQEKLARLKEEVSRYFHETPEKVYTYSPHFDPALPNPEMESISGRFTPESLQEFGLRVQDDLRNSIALQFREKIARIERRKSERLSGELENERELHESFVENRTRVFVGRKSSLQELYAYAAGSHRKIMAVYGNAGSGKSALLAHFYEMLTSLGPCPFDLVVPHFAGASPGSTSLPDLLRRMCLEIFEAFLRKEMENELSHTGEGESHHRQREHILQKYKVPSQRHKLAEAFLQFLSKAGKTLIIIDGLNQLDEVDAGQELYWLPDELPDNVKIIVSTLDGPARDALEKKGCFSMPLPGLTDEDRSEIVRAMPSVFCKTLDERQIALLLSKSETRNPLYLKVALDELRIFGSFEKLSEAIQSLPPDVVTLFVSVLDRLEGENGKEIVETLFSLLECSRYGLTEREIGVLMGHIDPEKKHLAVLRQVRDYIHRRGELIDFFHRGLSKAVRSKYLETVKKGWLSFLAPSDRSSGSSACHKRLALYFMREPLYLEPNVPNLRKLIEQPWQLLQGGLWRELAETLCGLKFIQAKLESGLFLDLQEDYSRALASWPGFVRYDPFSFPAFSSETAKKLPKTKERGQFPTSQEIVSLSEEVAHEVPDSFFGEDETGRKIVSWVRQECESWARQKIGPSDAPVRVEAFARFVSANLRFLLSSPRETIPLAFNTSERGEVGKAARGTIDSLSQPWIRREDLPKLWPLRPVLLRSLENGLGAFQRVAVSPDGTKAVSVGILQYPVKCSYLHVWDLRTGIRTRTVSVPGVYILGLSILEDGDTLVTLDPSGKIVQIWSIRSGECKKNISLPKITGTPSLSEDGKYAIFKDLSSSVPGTIWDIEKKEVVAEIMELVYVSPHGSVAVSQEKNTLSLWDISVPGSPRRFARFRHSRWDRPTCYHVSLETGVMLAGDKGTTLGNSFVPGNLSIIDLKSGKCLSMFQFAEEIRFCSVLAQGRIFFFWDGQNHGYLWDLAAAKCLKKIVGYEIRASAHSGPYGNIMVSGGEQALYCWDILGGFPPYEDEGHFDLLRDVCLSPDGKKAVSVYSPSAVPKKTVDLGYVWDMETKERLYPLTLSGSRGAYKAVASDRIVLTSGWWGDKTIHAWDIHSGKHWAELDGHPKDIRYLILSPDQNALASADEDGTICLWNIGPSELRFSLKAHPGGVTAISFSWDGKDLFTGGKEGLVKIWDASTGECKGEMEHPSGINWLEPSSDGKLLFSSTGEFGHGNAGLRVWEMASSKCLLFHSHTSFCRGFHLTLDGRKVISWDDRELHLWDICTQRMESFACPHLADVLGANWPYKGRVELTPDGLGLLMFTRKFIRLFDFQAGKILTSFPLDVEGKITSICPDGRFVCGTSHAIHFYRLCNFLKTPIVSGTRMWLFEKESWSPDIRVKCPWCGNFFALPMRTIAAIEHIQSRHSLGLQDSPCLMLPQGAWEDPTLLLECAPCSKSLKSTPFFMDRGGVNCRLGKDEVPFAVVCPTWPSDAGSLRKLGELLRSWKETSPGVTRILGLERMLEGKCPEVSSFLLMLPVCSTDLQSKMKKVALVVVDEGTDEESIAASLCGLVEASRLASVTSWEQYSYMNR